MSVVGYRYVCFESLFHKKPSFAWFCTLITRDLSLCSHSFFELPKFFMPDSRVNFATKMISSRRRQKRFTFLINRFHTSVRTQPNQNKQRLQRFLIGCTEGVKSIPLRTKNGLSLPDYCV